MYNPMDVGRIDRQIEELQRLKANYQALQQPQQPINNIITSQPIQPQQPLVPLFEAKFTNENPADVFIQHKTAFIDLKNGKLTIKETDGELKEYGLILPKDEKDVKIAELEAKMKNLENSYNALLTQTLNPNSVNMPIVEPTISQQTSVIDKHIPIVETSSINPTQNNVETTTNDITTDPIKPFSGKKGMFKQK